MIVLFACCATASLPIPCWYAARTRDPCLRVDSRVDIMLEAVGIREESDSALSYRHGPTRDPCLRVDPRVESNSEAGKTRQERPSCSKEPTRDPL